MIEVIENDLVEMAKYGSFDVIVHGCNCFHTMGAGIASQIAKEFPQAYETDKRTRYGDDRKLGHYSSATIYDLQNSTGLTIINAYTQFRPSPPVDYIAIGNVFENINLIFTDCRIGIPRIGSGLAGGNEQVIEQIIRSKIKDVRQLTIVDYNP